MEDFDLVFLDLGSRQRGELLQVTRCPLFRPEAVDMRDWNGRRVNSPRVVQVLWGSGT